MTTVVTEEADSSLTSINAALSTPAYLRAMWERREFAIEVPMEEMRSQHRTTLLGNVWHLTNPLLLIAVYYLVFGTLMAGHRPEDFLFWLTVGLFGFMYTQRSITGGATALVGNAGLLRAIRFPRALLPVSTVVSNLLTFVMELGVVAVIVLLGGFGPSRRWLALPVVVAVHTALNLGGAFVTARLNDNFRDVQQLMPFIFRLLRYMSSVMFPLERVLSGENVPTVLKTILALNPLPVLLGLYRWIFIGEPVDWGNVASVAILSVALLWFGFRFFRAAEHRYGRA